MLAFLFGCGLLFCVLWSWAWLGEKIGYGLGCLAYLIAFIVIFYLLTQ